ncbi:MAG TPA: carbohydrate kinase family protein [Candidatus Dormibacteraeota bacterium]|nr:carbohydrate kinase family protein [Candidatus Dormibacteraeota bacterium]
MIVSIGDLVQDISIVLDGPLEPDDDSPAAISIGGGGQAANFCAWSAAVGEPARLVTRVGDDDAGRRLVAELEGRGVEVRAVWAAAEPTGAIAVLIAADGRRTMATQRGASAGLSPSDLEESWFADARLLHVPAYSLFVEPIASAARAAIRAVRDAGGMLAVDLSSAAGLRAYGPSRMAYVLARLAPELLFATRAEAETLAVPLDGLAQVPVLKLGSEGVNVFGHHVAAPRVAAVDPTGAGDAFAAAFCAAWLHGATPLEAAERGVQAATQSVLFAGARPS